MPTGVHTLVRSTHEDRILRVLLEQGALTRGEIAERVGLSRTTLSEISSELLNRGAIAVVPGPQQSGRGRPAERLALDPAAGQLIGVEFAHRRVHVAVSSLAREVLASVAATYAEHLPWAERIAVAMSLLDSISANEDVHFNAVQGIGVGFPGPFAPGSDAGFDATKSEARRQGAELVRTEFNARFDAPVLIDNNARLAGLAEAIWDNTSDAQNLLYVRLSHGIGGGLVVGGRLVTGASGAAGEYGHMSVNALGTRCRCGKRGCLETVASTGAVFSLCTQNGASIASIGELADAAAKGDPIVLDVLREAGEAVGKVLGAVAVAVNPAEIVIAGEIAQVSEVLLEQARRTIAYELLAVSPVNPRIRLARLGDDGGALGAIAALFRSSPLLASYPGPPKLGAPFPNRTQRSV